MTFTETVMTVTIWVLLAAGVWFGGRARWRRRRSRTPGGNDRR